MQLPFFGTVEAVVYEPVSSSQDVTRECLGALGIVQVAFVTTLEELRTALTVRTPDILLCDVDRNAHQVHALVQALRRSAATPNPFLTVVGLTWSQEEDVASGLRDAGADDVLYRPLTADSLAECLVNQIERRKKFVVTADYIGPDRRRDPSRSGEECFEVVNSLNLKSLDLGVGCVKLLKQELRLSRAMLNAQRLRRNAFQLCVQWRLLERRRAGAPDFREALQRMHAISTDTVSRLSGAGHAAALQYCAALDAALGAVQTALDLAREGHPSSRLDLRAAIGMVGEAVMVLALLFAPEDLEPANLLALDQLVARIDVRRPEPAPQPDAFSPVALNPEHAMARAG